LPSPEAPTRDRLAGTDREARTPQHANDPGAEPVLLVKVLRGQERRRAHFSIHGTTQSVYSYRNTIHRLEGARATRG